MSFSTINVARAFSQYPGGRYYRDGKFSGQRFREELLVPELEHSDHVTVNFDGLAGHGSSFLEEAFGGLVREHGYDASDLAKRLTFISTEDEDLDYTIRRYIEAAGVAAAREKVLIQR